MKREDVIRKVRACMRLSKSANEAEAAAAARQAAKMMEQFHIDQADLAEEDRDPIVEDATDGRRGKSLPIYMIALAELVQELFGCEMFRSVVFDRYAIGSNYINKLVFVGPRTAVVVAIYSFQVLLRQLERDRRKHLQRVRKQVNRASRGDLFGIGWVNGCRAALGEWSVSLDPRLPSYMATKHATLTESAVKPRRSKAVSENDIISGFRNGKKAELQRAVTGHAQRAIGGPL